MGTCNYTTQSDFDLYIYDEDLDDTLDKDSSMNEYNFSMACVYETSKRLAKELSEKLIFHDIEIETGYYSGIQTFVEEYYEDIDLLNNEDCHYYFDMCRSKTLRKYKAEVNKINKKLLPLFKKELGFDHIRCIGVFSNGEAIYQKVN